MLRNERISSKIHGLIIAPRAIITPEQPKSSNVFALFPSITNPFPIIGIFDSAIISLSALTSVNEVSQMFASGMNGYIAKPLHKEKLFTAFSMFINTELNTVEEEVVEEVKELVYEGLDIHKGIEQADGNSMLYKELLGEFRDAYGQSHQVFKDLVEDHRYEQAKMLCLDLQGLAGSICADDMHKLATEMHKQLIYKKYDLLPKYIKAYTIELKILNNSITEYVT